jgi:hypothetical protein
VAIQLNLLPIPHWHAACSSVPVNETGSKTVRISKLLDKLAANPWAMSCTGFVLTALLMLPKEINAF